MTPESTLPVIAQIAATFAGFTALVSIVDQSQGGSWARISIWRIMQMLRISLTLMVMCFLPVLLLSFRIPVNITWQICILVSLCVAIGNMIWLTRVQRDLKEDSRRLLNKTVFRVNSSLSVIMLPVQFLALLPIWSVDLSAVYLLAMVVNLVVAALIFFALVQQLDLQRVESEEKTGKDEPENLPNGQTIK